MLLCYQCDFVIHPEDWEACTTEEGVVISKETMDYLLSQTVGVARGILHCKTESTAYNGFVLPPMNVSEVIAKDIIIVSEAVKKH